jgi:hypothetical protein
VMALPQTVFAAIDGGVMVFGVEHPGVTRGVQSVLARLGVPASAYRIEISEPIHFMNTLRDEIRPVMGGLQIHWSQYVCTLGFSAAHAGGLSMFTNSHCTDNQGTTGSTQYNQPTRTVSPDPIAIEAHDPEYFRGGDCPRGKVCRYSDASRALYQSGVGAEARIARTTGVNSGSLDLNGYFTITAQDNTTRQFGGGTFHKVGRTTGWTSGSMGQSCVNINVSGSNIHMLCQTTVNASVAGGDSGSPVFTVQNSNATLVGILWGGSSSGNLFVFSPLEGIVRELGALNAVNLGDSGGGTPPPDDGGDNGDGGGGGGGNCPPGNPNHPRCSRG